MLKIMIDDGKATVRVEGSIATITFDLVIAVRALISSLAEQNEMCADMLLGFCKYALPKLADPEVDLNNVDDILDEAVKEHRKAAEEEAKKSLKQTTEMVIKTIRDMLNDLEDDKTIRDMLNDLEDDKTIRDMLNDLEDDDK